VPSFLRRAIALALFCATALLSLWGCERSVAPPLVEVTELSPRAIEPGDRLEVHGSGFPQGRQGRVTLEGSIFRPGEARTRGVTIETEGTVATPDRLEIVVRDALAERFCGYGDRASHATFRGDVEVSFASTTPGAPPLVGILRGATLDVEPSSARASITDARVVEGGRLLAFLGVVPGAPTPRGVPIEQVRAGSLAARSGFQVGDVLAAVDGVHVLTLGDVVPASARAVELTIRHADSGLEETKTLSLIEYSGERVPAEYAPALVLVGLALAVLVLLVLPGPPSLAALEMRIASRVRRTTLGELFGSLVGSGRHAALSAIATAMIAAFALTPYVVGPELDGAFLLTGAAAMLVWSRVAGEPGPLASLRTFVQLTAAALAMVGAIALTIVQVGAIELAELVRLQGGAPWQFTAARHPACAILALVYGAAIVGIIRTRMPSTVTPATNELDRRAKAAPAPAVLLERGGLLAAAGLGVTTFFGGWQLPGITAPRAHGLLLVAAMLFAAKTWVAAALLFGAGRVASSFRPREVVGLVWKRLLPGLLVAAALVAVSRRLVPSMAVETAFGATLVAVAALFFVRLAARVHAAATRPEPHASPFL
jgi:NADH-quinone oxidoreductase subunit H